MDTTWHVTLPPVFYSFSFYSFSFFSFSLSYFSLSQTFFPFPHFPMASSPNSPENSPEKEIRSNFDTDREKLKIKGRFFAKIQNLCSTWQLVLHLLPCECFLTDLPKVGFCILTICSFFWKFLLLFLHIVDSWENEALFWRGVCLFCYLEFMAAERNACIQFEANFSF